MNKELARYFVKLIAEDLQFSFNGMGIPSYSCEWLENQLMQGNFEDVNYDKTSEEKYSRYVDYSEYLELRRENKHTNEVQSIGVLYAVNEKITALFLKNKAVIFCSF